MTTKEMVLLALDTPQDTILTGAINDFVSAFQSFTPFLYNLVKLMKPAKVFEWGMGQSTNVFLFSDKDVIVTTHEECQYWADKYKAELISKDPDWSKRLDTRVYPTELPHDYIHADFPDETFDIVLVDGFERGKCMVEAARTVKKEGVILAHDTQRQGLLDSFNSVLNPNKIEYITTDKPELSSEATSIWIRRNC